MDQQESRSPHPIAGFVLQVGDAEKFPRLIIVLSLDPFLRVSKQGQCLTAIEKDRGDKRLVQLDLACEADETETRMVRACHMP